MADAHGLAHDDTATRDELIARLSERLRDAQYLQDRLRSLTDEERSILVSARASSGELRGLLVDADHPGAAESLADRGWLFRVFAASGPLRGEVFVVPDELLALLPAPSRSDGPRAETEPPAAPRWTDPAFSLFALASALTRPGGDVEAELRPWSQEPGGWAWDARRAFLQHLAAAAGLLVHGTDGKLAPASHLPRLLDDRPALAERLWRSYIRDRASSELQASGIAAEEDLVDTLALRQSVVDVLEHLPTGEWFAWEALSGWLQRAHPRLLREQLTPRGLVLFHATEWVDLEEPLLRYFCLGPLYWLGQVAASRDGRLISRRLQAGSVEAEAAHWEGTADLVAPARVQLGTLLQAERYLVLRHRDRISRYHLVQGHVAAALGGGGSIAECRQLLRKLTQAALPDEIEARLVAWDRRFGALDIRPAVLLAARLAADLDEVLSVERVRPFVRSRLGPEVVEVAAADALELAAALRDSGHLPRVDAALRLGAEPRRAYAGLVDEQVLEFLLVSLLAFGQAWPERLSELEGSAALLERLEHQFPPERLRELRAAANRLAGTLVSAGAPPKRKRRRKA